MTVRSAARCVDHVAVAQILEETWQTQRIHTAGDDWCCWLHSVPLLEVDWALALVALDHVSDDLIVALTFHFAVSHGTHVDAGSTLQTGHLGQHKRCVTALGRRRSHHAVTGAVVVQVLAWVLTTCSCHHARAADETVHQERNFVCIGTECFQREVSAGAHFVVVIGSNVEREQLGIASFILCALQCICN